MKQIEPITVRLWRCNNCHRILGQEVEDGKAVEPFPQCRCEAPLWLTPVKVED